MLAVGPLSGLQEYSPESEYLNTSLTIVFKLPSTPGGDDDQLDRGDLGLVHDERDARPRSPEWDVGPVVLPESGPGGAGGGGDCAGQVDDGAGVHKHVRPSQDPHLGLCNTGEISSFNLVASSSTINNVKRVRGPDGYWPDWSGNFVTITEINVGKLWVERRCEVCETLAIISCTQCTAVIHQQPTCYQLRAGDFLFFLWNWSKVALNSISPSSNLIASWTSY